MRGVFDQGHATVPAVRLASKMCPRAAAVQDDRRPISDVTRHHVGQPRPGRQGKRVDGVRNTAAIVDVDLSYECGASEPQVSLQLGRQLSGKLRCGCELLICQDPVDDPKCGGRLLVDSATGEVRLNVAHR
jgi:hypothetical protein